MGWSFGPTPADDVFKLIAVEQVLQGSTKSGCAGLRSTRTIGRCTTTALRLEDRVLAGGL
jgi:hypothetical protein